MRHTTLRLIALLMILLTVGVFGITRYLLSQKRDDPMKGDSDEAIVALADKLHGMPTTEHGAYLLNTLQGGSDALRFAVVDELVKANPPGTTDALEKAFQDSCSLVRIRAMETLWTLDPVRGKHLLLVGLCDEDSWVRDAAIAQLSIPKQKLADKSKVPEQIRALDDADPSVVFTSANLLNRLTGQPWRIRITMTPAQKQEAVAHWKAWWQQNRGAAFANYTPVTPISPTRSDPSPDFSVQDIDGDTISLSGQQGRITLLNFWGTWCPPCQREVPDLAKLDTAYRDKKVDVVGIALAEDSADSLRNWCKQHGLKYRQVMAEEAIKQDFGHIEEVPVSFLIDGQGKVRYHWEGERDFGTFQAAVERLLKETH